MTKAYTIVPAGPCWEAKENLSNKVILRSPTKRDLVLRTFELAKKEPKCKVVIQTPDGAIEEERIFEENPEKKLADFMAYYQSNL
ncbi:MAG: DUF2188 domain-containing protein [Cytophagaceae bacterium]